MLTFLHLSLTLTFKLSLSLHFMLSLFLHILLLCFLYLLYLWLLLHAALAQARLGLVVLVQEGGHELRMSGQQREGMLQWQEGGGSRREGGSRTQQQ